MLCVLTYLSGLWKYFVINLFVLSPMAFYILIMLKTCFKEINLIHNDNIIIQQLIVEGYLTYQMAVCNSQLLHLDQLHNMYVNLDIPLWVLPFVLVSLWESGLVESPLVLVSVLNDSLCTPVLFQFMIG